ncbi:MAG TPA: hypothetical protein VL358_00380 [Caulobacteraceae bacterium]|jgi:hypothetical protein|nr:hypothetical protein [Caulobacteraceae bacterium]
MKRLIIAAAATAALALSACETATPYQPLTRGSATSGGYSERALEPNRWQVSFSGNSLTDRRTVETYLLYRSAELTLAQGYDWFEIVDRNTDAKTRVYPDAFYDPWGYGGFWGPSWRVYGGRFGGWSRYGYWGGWGGRPWAWGPADYQSVTQYEATAEIFMGKGAKPANDPKAFDARAVQTRLGPTIARPT